MLQSQFYPKITSTTIFQHLTTHQQYVLLKNQKTMCYAIAYRPDIMKYYEQKEITQYYADTSMDVN